jgi:hypothetical protein
MVLVSRSRRQNEIPEWLMRQAPNLEATLPLRELLEGSLYYPASEFDGWPVKHLGGLVHSFVYVDYGPPREELAENIRRGFVGYHLYGQRDVLRQELAPENWRPSFQPALSTFERDVMSDVTRAARKEPFCKWFVFERNAERSPDHGPARFSLLYLRADGIAAYEPLYVRNKCRPWGLALIRSDTGFSGGYTALLNPDGPLHRIVMRNAVVDGPQSLLVGWYDYTGQQTPWPEFSVRDGFYEQRALWKQPKKG